MKTISFIAASFATVLAQRKAEPIPTDGNFFYMVAHSGTNAPGINGYDVTVGHNSTGDGQLIPNVAISASEHFFRVVGDKNFAWDTTHKYNESESYSHYQAYDSSNKTIEPLVDDMLSVTKLPVSDGHQMKFENISIGTLFIYEDVMFNVTEFKRSVQLKGLGMGVIITSTSSKGKTPFYNGWMGIAPYQALPTDMQGFSFMQQLANNNVITNHVVAINARDSTSTTGTDTVVKFGGWDKNMTETG